MINKLLTWLFNGDNAIMPLFNRKYHSLNGRDNNVHAILKIRNIKNKKYQECWHNGAMRVNEKAAYEVTIVVK